MDALTLVRQEHRSLEELLQRCQRLDGDRDRDRQVLRRFQGAVRHHVDQEESILYPIFRERARRAEVDLGPLDRAVEQHRLIDRLASELTDPDGDARNAKLTVLAEQVRAHLDDENSVLLTAIEDLLDDDTLLELGRRMEQRERVIAARRELAATLVPGETRGRRLAALAALGGLAALGSALFAFLARWRRRPPRRQPAGWRRLRRR